jgi:glucose-1-phosphate thymidylyltransferase
MKGIILAGGLGTRLYPLTKITNKHLLPIHDKPMIYYPLQTLVNAGIRDILIVTGGNNAGDFLRLLGNGKEFGLQHINYTYQEGEGGIAAALFLAEYFSDQEKQENGAKILLKEVPDPQRFGVPEIKGDKIIRIEEKPAAPRSKLAVIGIYMYDAAVFDIIRTLKPSGRGELEITDVNNEYIRRGNLTYEILEGWWTDAGTFESLLRASNLVAQTGANKL